MWTLLKNAWKVVEVRKKLLFTFAMLAVIRLGSCIPIPGVNSSYIGDLLNSLGNTDAFGWFNAMTGGSFTDLSIFALSITPYITSSIIMQLLTIAIPALERLQKEGEDGRKKIAEYTRYVTIALALIESTAMAIGFKGMLYTWNAWSVIICIVSMTAGSAILMWIGEQINDRGIGNGISVVLLFNIVSSLPDDFNTLYTTFVRNERVAVGVLKAIIVLAVIIALVVFTIILESSTRVIPVQYSRKMQGRRMIGGGSASLPLKVNTAGVIPVIFASSLMSLPVLIAQFAGGINYQTFGGKILMCLSSSSWINKAYPWWANFGLLLYLVLIILFAYFYTGVTFNPLEIANNMKKNGGFVPGIRPGKPTSDYLTRILNYVIFIGAVGLMIVCIVPIIASGLFGVGRLSFTGTSLIIIVSVVVETIKTIESQLSIRNYKGFLND